MFAVDVVLSLSMECYCLFDLSRTADTNLQRATGKGGEFLFSLSHLLILPPPFSFFIFVLFSLFGGQLMLQRFTLPHKYC